jgi:hypothetical protein
MKFVVRMIFPEDVQRILPQPVAFVTPYLKNKHTHAFTITDGLTAILAGREAGKRCIMGIVALLVFALHCGYSLWSTTATPHVSVSDIIAPGSDSPSEISIKNQFFTTVTVLL